MLDRYTFSFTRSELEHALIPIALRAGLGMPLTCVYLNGYEVDFYWPELRLVVETDGGRYHRTAMQQTKDRLRDQAHFRSRLIAIRFTHDQIAHDAAAVRRTLEVAASRACGTSPASASTSSPRSAPPASTWPASTGT
jgi:hypothetical protein